MNKWVLTEAVTRAVLPVKSSAPHMSTSSRPKGRPKAPYTIFWSPGFVDARPGHAPPTERARKLPKPINAPPRMPIIKVLEIDSPALVCPAAVACSEYQTSSSVWAVVKWPAHAARLYRCTNRFVPILFKPAHPDRCVGDSRAALTHTFAKATGGGDSSGTGAGGLGAAGAAEEPFVLKGAVAGTGTALALVKQRLDCDVRLAPERCKQTRL